MWSKLSRDSSVPPKTDSWRSFINKTDIQKDDTFKG